MDCLLVGLTICRPSDLIIHQSFQGIKIPFPQATLSHNVKGKPRYHTLSSHYGFSTYFLSQLLFHLLFSRPSIAQRLLSSRSNHYVHCVLTESAPEGLAPIFQPIENTAPRSC